VQVARQAVLVQRAWDHPALDERLPTGVRGVGRFTALLTEFGIDQVVAEPHHVDVPE